MFDEDGNYIICQKTGKRGLSYKEADLILAKARNNRKHHHKTKVIPKRKYFCDSCKYYHLTSMSYERVRADRTSAKRHKKYIKKISNY